MTTNQTPNSWCQDFRKLWVHQESRTVSGNYQETMGLRPGNSPTAIENRKPAHYFTCRLTVKLRFSPTSRKTAKYFYFPRGFSRKYRKTPFYIRNLAGNCLSEARKRNPEMAFFDQEFGVWLAGTKHQTTLIYSVASYSS